jgi:beta-glucosidase
MRKVKLKMSVHIPSIKKVTNINGPELAFCVDSGVKIIEQDGLLFKDLSKDGEFHPFEDWRLTPEERARDLASRLSIDQLAGLILHSSHQFVPGLSNPYFGITTYYGKAREESGAPVYALSDKQIDKIQNDFIRHMLVAAVKTPADAAMWNNNLQALAEKMPFSIPVGLSSDPRHGTIVSFEFDVGASGDTSHWPEPIGLAATFDANLVKQFGEIASEEYRAMGITTALSPQIDLSADPRWCRFQGTFGESPELSADMARAYCDGFQTSSGNSEIKDGWGLSSVNAMCKHWPGGGAIEGGRDAHFACGKYSVYPGNNFDEHLAPFIDGAFKLDGKTSKASAVMPYYTVVYGQDEKYGENVGCSYSKYLITDLLREKYGYDELVCTDWGILRDPAASVDSLFGGKCWGVEGLTIEERCYKAFMAGVDQFGGLDDKNIVMSAHKMGVQEHGETFMRKRFELSGMRVLKNLFRTGLFENPYLAPDISAETVGNDEFIAHGYEAQVKSIIMLKNENNALPLAKKSKLYIPKLHIPSFKDWMGVEHPERWEYTIDLTLVNQYFDFIDDPKLADAALCIIRRPDGAASSMLAGYSKTDLENGGNGYVPISLQYRPYTATNARAVSIAGGDPTETFIDRSYNGKTVTVDNESDLDVVLNTRKAMGNKPVIVCVKMVGPLVMQEFEPSADAILGSFGEQPKAVLEILCGMYEPSGLLPLQIPANMKTVEEQLEDVPFDVECHVDKAGNIYDFAFGMNWNGKIKDARVKKYIKNKA